MRRPLACLLAAGALGLSACGTDADAARAAGATGSAAGPSAGAAQAEAFPVTLRHRHGSTVVPERPQRVVSVGFNDHDTLLALGVTPVGVRDWYGDQPSATWPWAQDELGDARPTVLGADELDVEAVAALEPDLIVGIFSGMSKEQYDLLSQVAPTVASADTWPDFGTPWRDVTRTYARALGVVDRGEQVVGRVEQQLAAARKAHPEFDGASGTVTFYSAGQLGAYTTADLRSRLLAELGFEVPQEVDRAAGKGAFFAPVSLERADLVDRDVLLWITATEQEIAQVRGLPLRRTLDAAEQGREVFLPFELNGAMSFSSPLSIPYAVDALVPELAAAVDGDPATPVPSAR